MAGQRKRLKPPAGEEGDVDDLQTQLEELLSEVWACERRERLQDRLDQSPD